MNPTAEPEPGQDPTEKLDLTEELGVAAVVAQMADNPALAGLLSDARDEIERLRAERDKLIEGCVAECWRRAGFGADGRRRSRMRRFAFDEIREAKAFAASGGQALHLHRIIVNRARAPRCFVAAVDRGEDIAHLFDQDVRRLRATACRLGVRVVVVERPGTPGQHLDLCAGPLRKALAMCGSAEGRSS